MPNFITPTRIERYNLPPGNEGSLHTANRIKHLIKQGTSNFNLRQFVISEMLRGVPEKDYLAEIRAIHEWVRTHLIYRKDPVGIDQIVAAPEVLQMILNGVSGFDCDDMVVFEGACLRVAGIPVDLVILKANHRVPDSWSHIYLIAYDLKTGTAIPLDPIMKGGHYPAGWEGPHYFDKKIIALDGLAGNFGIGAYEYERIILGTRYIAPTYTNGIETKWNQYLAAKREFARYIDMISDAFDKDIANVLKNSQWNDLQKEAEIKRFINSRNTYIQRQQETNIPQEPPGVPIALKIVALERQNEKLRDHLLDLQEIKRLSKIINQIGEMYLNRLQEEEIKLQKRAARRLKNQLKLKIFRDASAVALSFVPYIGQIVGMAGTMVNKIYEQAERVKNARWMVHAIRATEYALGPGDAELYCLTISDDIDHKVQQIEDTINLKIEINEMKLEQLKIKPIDAVEVPTVAVPERIPQKMSTRAKVALGGAAATFLWFLL